MISRLVPCRSAIYAVYDGNGISIGVPWRGLAVLAAEPMVLWEGPIVLVTGVLRTDYVYGTCVIPGVGQSHAFRHELPLSTTPLAGKRTVELLYQALLNCV